MNILAAADLHGAHATYAWLAEVALERRPAAVVLAGDLLSGRGELATIEESQEADARKTLALLAKVPCPVLYIMGNDDMVELPSGFKDRIPLHGRRHELGRFNFVGYQYSLPFMAGRFEKPEEGIAADLRELAPLVDASTVLVTHSPAFGILDLGLLDRNAGSRSILALIEARRPRAHIHGHIHQQVGRSGSHFNVGTAGRRRALLLDLVTLEDEVIEVG